MGASLFLIGFMGSGKTFIGQKLAEALGFDFIDMDHYLEEKTGATIPEVFEREGEVYFRQLEHNILLELKDKSNCVFSTGGGAPCFHGSMEIMNECGITVYLKVEPKNIVKRISDQRTHRPLLRNFANDFELLNFVKNKIAERNEFYSQAKIIVDANGDAEEIVTKIISLVC